MTARSKKQRQRNLSIKREKQKVKDLAKLRKLVGLPEAMDEDHVQVVDAEKLAKKQQKREEAIIEEEFIAEKTKQIIGKKVKVVNENTKKEHVYDTRTMKDQYGMYPVWYRANKIKRKINKRKVGHSSNFWTANFVPS
ncbi:uncharacterized protein LOC134836791 [Culicoides brevitarsis]|uniref:uncharacterized protein LOC134836791 n=1 Tax=Culicoides brevitarsis TaxID=469753 RepID=UPI00307C58E2